MYENLRKPQIKNIFFFFLNFLKIIYFKNTLYLGLEIKGTFNAYAAVIENMGAHFSQNSTAEKNPKLLDQVRFAIQTKHYSIRTEESYIHELHHPKHFS